MYRSGVSIMWSGELALLLIEKLSFKLQKKPNKTEDHSPEERNKVKSLRSKCTSVITSSLMEQKSLKARKLHRKLPTYVPTTVRKTLIKNFKMAKRNKKHHCHQ